MVDNSQYEGWGTETGLVDNFVLRVDEAWFATDARYNNGETLLLNWKGKTDQPIGSDDEYEFTVSYPVGNGWVSEDGGKTAKSEKGKSKFNVQSYYGRIIESVMTPKDEGGLGIIDLIAKRGRQTEAKVWTGLTFRMRQVEFNYGGDIGKRSRLMPVEFLGENADPADYAEEGTTDAAAGVKTGTTASEATTTASPAALEARLRAMAKVAPDHGTFVDKALEIPAVSEDAGLLERVVDESKLWSEARA